MMVVFILSGIFLVSVLILVFVLMKVCLSVESLVKGFGFFVR